MPLHCRRGVCYLKFPFFSYFFQGKLAGQTLQCTVEVGKPLRFEPMLEK